LIAILALSLLVYQLVNITTSSASGTEGVIVVVTFSYLKPDVERLLCGGVVYTIVPPGVDPHDYQLKPSDLDILRRADLIISTGHTAFEIAIKELARRGELKALVLDMVDDLNLTLRVNPTTKQVNYHMPINDPANYLVFLSRVVELLSTIDRGNRACYYERFHQVVSALASRILVYQGVFRGGKVVVDKPHVQYLVEWLGLEVAQIFKAEEGYQVTPQDVKAVEDLMRRGEVGIVVVTEPADSPEASRLIELARAHGVPVVKVASPASDKGVFNNLELTITQVRERSRLSSSVGQEGGVGVDRSPPLLVTISVLSAVLGLIVGYYIGVRRAGAR
jgi:zinc/manganese transport system substrate-binding protein